MNVIYEVAKTKYINYKSLDSFEKLYRKVSRSDALNELCGISARRGLPPTAADFTYKASLMPSIYITFDSAKSSMVALIMLKIWDERINSVYHLCAIDVVRTMAYHIVSDSVVLR